MLIYLDSRDLISLIEKRATTETDAFERGLLKKSARLVFSMHNIFECCPPLLQQHIQTNVMKTLNRLEKMPHLYIAETKIKALELKEGTDAFLNERDYRAINPFVPRFDYVISPFRKPATSHYLNYSLSEIIFDLWRESPDVFEGYQNYSKRLNDKMILDRKRKDYKKHKENFPYSIYEYLLLFNIPFPKEKINKFTEWLWDDTNLCPSFRLMYEVYHRLLRNLKDQFKSTDIPDLAHVCCVPYIDAATLDNRIRGYIEQVDFNIGTRYLKRVYRNIDELNVLLN